MCDTLCTRSGDGMLFAKNSDRPPGEPQVVEHHPPRRPADVLRTQYLEIPDAGARAVLGSRPSWLWGFEHGVNDRAVAIGNERVYTVHDPERAEPALIGMDLVRLGLERGGSADEAVDVMTALLEKHGQGGVADAADNEAYFSSFLVADPDAAWVLETSGRTWATRRVGHGAAISNRLSITTDWDRASAEVGPGADFDAWRDPDAWTAHADRRLDATTAVAVRQPERVSAHDLVALLRHHGEGAWGTPGDTGGPVGPLPPRRIGPDGTGVTVCMHVRGHQVTTSSMVAELRPAGDAARPVRAWVALGSPCVSVYVPVFPPDGVPAELADERTWSRFAALRNRVEGPGGHDDLARVRSVLAPLEAALWEDADASLTNAAARRGYLASVWPRLDAALRALDA